MLVSYTFDIDVDVKEKLDEIAKKERRTLASQIRLALDYYLEKR